MALLKKFKLEELCYSTSSRNDLIKGKQIQNYREGLYPAFSATGQDIWRDDYEHDGEAIIVSAVGARCGKCFRAKGKWTAIANTHIIFAKENVSTDFLFYYLNNEHFWERGGVAQPFVKIKDSLRRKTISMPVNDHGELDINEQYRIVDLLKEAEQLQKKRAIADQKMKEVIPALFNEMFGNAKLESRKLGDSISYLTSGARGWAKYYSNESGYKYIRIQNVKDAQLHFDDVQFVNPPDSAEAKRIKVQENDLLISITADLGRTAVVDSVTALNGAYINQHLALVRLNADFNAVFVAHYLENNGKSQFAKYGQAAAKKGLNFDSIKSLMIPCPPVKIQNEFVDKVQKILHLKENQKESAQKIESLFTSLLTKCVSN